ncbi:MAG: ATP-binding cassette domain-containing protein [Actinomycetota bacterium]|nr:ATP-binding cassette domain-containing protein [Actinomycetota bacterium]
MLTADEVVAPAPLRPPEPVLSVRGVARHFGPGCVRCAETTGSAAGTNRCAACGTVVAVRSASFDVGPGEVVGVLGESGSGKTTLLRTLHLDAPADDGTCEVAGIGDLFEVAGPVAELQRSTVVMVHQNALAAGLHPSLAAESNVAERLLATGARSVDAIHTRATELLAELEVDPARHRDRLRTFSGGMAQRVQLARALVDPPPVLLLDEPTTGLDPSVQASLLDTIERVTARLAGATVVVTHDLGVVRVLASRVVVMHHGEIVEEGVVDQILEDPAHPYTQLLVSSRL